MLILAWVGVVCWLLLFRLFPGKPNRSSECGGGGGEKEARRQEDVARQAESVLNIGNQFLSQLVPGSQEYNELQAEIQRLWQTSESPLDEQSIVRELGQRLVSQQQARAAAGEPITALEARTQKAFEGLRGAAGFTSEEQAVFNALRGLQGTGEPGQAAGVEDIFSQLVARSRDPNQFFQSTLRPQLDLAEQANRAAFASRGLLRSGLEQEGATRSGQELAIREAEAQEAFRQQQLGNFQNLFNVGQQLRGREIGVEEAFTNLQLGRESNLTQLLAAQTGRRGDDLVSLLQRQTGRAEDLFDTAAQQEAARKASLGKSLGTALGAGAGFLVGGPPGAVIGASIGGGASGLLASQQAAPAAGGTRQLSGGLSRSPQPIGQLTPDELAALLARTN